MTKKLLSLLLIVILSLGATGYAQAGIIGVTKNTIGIRLDGAYINADNFLFEGTTYVPIRAISEYFGAQVSFDQETMTATIKTGSKTNSTSNQVEYVVSTNETIEDVVADKNLVTLIVDDKKIETDNYLLEGTTYVPLRAVSNALNCIVNFDQMTKSARIYSSNFLNFAENDAIYFNGEKLSKDAFSDLAKFVYNGKLDAAKEDKYKAISDFLLATLSAKELLKKFDIKITPEEIAEFNKQNNVEAFIKELNIKDTKLFSDVVLTYFIFMNKAQTGALDKKMLEVYVPTDEELILEFVKSPYSQGDYMKAKHILIAKDEKGEGLKKAKDLLAKIKGGADFDKLMQENSTDPGSKAQPDGYIFKEGDMVTEFYDGAKNLKENEVSGIVESQFGYHIIKKVADYKGGVPFQILKPDLLKATAMNSLQKDFLNQRITKDIAINEKIVLDAETVQGAKSDAK